MSLARSGLYVYTRSLRSGGAWANLSLIPQAILSRLSLSEGILVPNVNLDGRHAVWVGTYIFVWVGRQIWFGAGLLKSGVFTSVPVWPHQLSKGEYYLVTAMASAKNTLANEFCLTVLTFPAKET